MSSEFWSSEEGILIRLEDLAHDFSFRTYNGAVKGFFKDSGVKEFEWVSVLDPHTCKYCESQHGRVYQANWFLPRIPAHVHCLCLWDLHITL